MNIALFGFVGLAINLTSLLIYGVTVTIIHGLQGKIIPTWFGVWSVASAFMGAAMFIIAMVPS